MFLAYVCVTVLAVLANVWEAVTSFARARFVRANAADVGVPHSWLPVLGALKGAGAVGLVLGLLGFRSIGIAAAAGLVFFMICAVAIHVRARVFHNIAFPGAFLGLAGAALVLAVVR
ncbi:DoxX family protein [Streptomyces erythrochromogenes]|uniref:DoxX family protein n=1 Tax=Streptomyces erythrochromogenes TaxID=285574 RepID=UPI0038257CBE